MILRRALAQTVAGSAIGLPVAPLAVRAPASELYGVSPGDPFVVNVAIAVLAGTAAALIPARRGAPRRSIR